MTSRSLRAVPDTPPRAVIYLRQSTYREESISLELQETAARDYCARQGYTVTAVEADPGISGRTWRRPAVQRVMSMIEEGAADVIVLWRWSRLSRSRKDWALAADRVDVAGGRIESATEPNDISAAGRFARGVMTEMNAFESERIGEMWRDVQNRRRAQGLPAGGKIPYGWRYREDGAVEPHPDQAPAIPVMYEMFLQGHGQRTIATWLEENGFLTYHGRTTWQPTSVTQTMQSPFHAGFLVHHGELLPGAHDPLISKDTYDRFLAMQRERADERAVKRRYLLSGILRCGNPGCGRPMFGFTVNNASKKAPYHGYRCDTLASQAAGTHGPATLATRFIDDAVIGWLRSLVDLDTAAPPSPAPIPHAKLDAQRIAREITALDRQVISLTEGLASGLVPERAYRVTVESLEVKRADLDRALRAAEDRISLAPDNPAEVAGHLLEQWDELHLDEKRASIRSLAGHLEVRFVPGPRQLIIHPRWDAEPVTIEV